MRDRDVVPAIGGSPLGTPTTAGDDLIERLMDGGS